MEKIKKILLVVFCLSMCFSCSESVNDLEVNDLKSGHLGAGKDGDMKKVTVPFKVDYIGTYQPFGDRCAANVIVDGEGSGTHVGASTVHFDFCVDPTIFGPDSTWYGDSYAYIIAANGDSLFVSVTGAVVQGRLEDHPEYVISYWRDPVEILGGSGRFEGASGTGWTDDYDSIEDANSHHHWEGTITMMKGKR